MTQDAVMEFTEMRRERIRQKYRDENAREISAEDLDEMQPQIDEWDPVVELALIGADYRHKVEIRRQANSDAAQYLRPKLKSIELLEDPESLELQEEKNQLAKRMVEILSALEQAKRNGV